jgi:hypothetical protein
LSNAGIEQLLADRSLVREEFRDDQVVSFWTKAAASYANAALPGFSSEGAFQQLYTAALQAAIATLAAHGLRVKSTANHYKTFYALRKLDAAPEPHGAAFDEMRGTRNDSVYEPTHDEVELKESLAEARVFMPEAMSALRTAILAVRPGVEGRLSRVS